MTPTSSETSPPLERSLDEPVEELSSQCDSPVESHDVDVSDGEIASEVNNSDDVNGSPMDSAAHSPQFEICTSYTSQDDDAHDDNATTSLTTPTFSTADQRHQAASASTKKFVHFLSDVESTPIQTEAVKSFVEDDADFLKCSFELNAPRLQQVHHARPATVIHEEAEDDEKKEELPSLLLVSADAQLGAHAMQDTEARTTPAKNSSPPRTSVVDLPTIPPATKANTPSPSRISYVSPPGRRTITLRLQEEVDDATGATNNGNNASQLTPFRRLSSLRRFRSLSLSTVMIPLDEKGKVELSTHDMPGGTNASKGDNAHEPSLIDRGIITVSWYDGTTSAEMQQHVYNCVLRKLKSNDTSNAGGSKKKLEDVRLLDENVVPHEEVVLCPFLPDGSNFLLKFKTSTPQPPPKQPIPDPYNLHHHRIPPYISRAPDSPSAEPSPYPSSANLSGMNAQLHLLNAATALLQSNGIKTQPVTSNGLSFGGGAENGQQHHGLGSVLPKIPMLPKVETVPRNFMEHQSPVGIVGKDATTTAAGARDDATVNPDSVDNTNEKPVNVGGSSHHNNVTDAAIEQQLRQLNELFLLRNGASLTTNSSRPTNEINQPSDEDDHDPYVKYYKSQEKKQVIFIIANYFVLFMGIIAASAEIQSRLPQWMNWVQENYDSVQNCATDSDALMECILHGNFSGLVASFMLWATQSASAKRIFLFGFDTPKKLWTVVYEALVTAVCWGLSYLFIRRGLNPNTREKFIQKYWKDAVYGSLAGFNAAFMKAVLKNLVPQDVALQAIETRQLRIFNWLGMLMSEE
ncbi:hypothetical protein HJC23_012461 [Cyclotella cryptica]|uniref:Uncharacterized protein n=1 Tax=Cyclotella cryptica TaxID=29204 RepID=A0ABD3P4F7_9STRA|eukprot:CCRYP_017456-RA/>CCRYP_017456-RA protein AED:0.27 eAED:0.27 QI:302/1/1/1/1/1/2/764/802